MSWFATATVLPGRRGSSLGTELWEHDLWRVRWFWWQQVNKKLKDISVSSTDVPIVLPGLWKPCHLFPVTLSPMSPVGDIACLRRGEDICHCKTCREPMDRQDDILQQSHLAVLPLGCCSCFLMLQDPQSREEKSGFRQLGFLTVTPHFSDPCVWGHLNCSFPNSKI